MFFDTVPLGLPDPIFGLADTFQKDPRKEKINLILGIYKDEALNSKLIGAVVEAKKKSMQEEWLADYLPISGNALFVEKIAEILFGKDLYSSIQERVAGAQSVGGTGALCLGASFYRSFVGNTIYIPDPTWINHRHIFERAGCKVESYPYYNKKKRCFDFDAMIASLKAAEKKSAVLLHGVCHNPSGCDPTEEQWQKIIHFMQRNELLPFFDLAYQGFGVGLHEDASAVRSFVKEGLDCMIGYSCSKNFSLYSQRVGAIFLVGKDRMQKERSESQIKRIIRALYSNPPSHGARIVQEVLCDPKLRNEWEGELKMMRERLSKMRNRLVEKLEELTSENLSYLLLHKGMFSFLDIQKEQVQRLMDEFAIYMPQSGRINVAGLNEQNLCRVAESIAAVMREMK